MLDLLVIGDANPDVLISGAPDAAPAGQAETLVESGVLALGGSAAIMAHGAARLGLATGFRSMVGRDEAGDLVLDLLSTAGVDISGCVRHESLPTGLTVCLNRQDGDRAILTSPGCLKEFGPEHVGEIEARHVHSSGYFLLPRWENELAACFRAARAAGSSTSLDTNDDPSGRWRLGPGLLDECTFVLPNAAEAVALTGVPGDALPAMLSALAGPGRTPVVKCGDRGSVALHEGVSITALPPRMTPLDTVGAGDSFDAGFLAGWLDSGDLGDALRLASACGALSTQGAGGTAAQPDLPTARHLATLVSVSSTALQRP